MESPVESPVADGWTSLHCMVHCTPETVDEFLLADVAPLLDRHGSEWFFIRYGEGGPHLRIRVRGDAGELAEPLATLASKLPSVPGPWTADAERNGRAHGTVHAIAYEPETERYGGASALPIAEEVFVHSTRIALRAIAETPRRAARLTTGIDLAVLTGTGLGLDRLATARWHRRHARGWQHAEDVQLLPAPLIHRRVDSVYAGQRASLVRRVDALCGSEPPPSGLLGDWVSILRHADGRLRSEAACDDDRRLWAWSSQLHMLFNRMGIVPDEERALCYLAARALLERDESDSFFPSDAGAPDVRFLERSKFHIGSREDSASREVASVAPSVDDGIALPSGPLPDVTLKEALTRRVSTRGRLTGPLAVGELGTLLWNSYTETHQTGGHRHRPYPSAGALYTARLRIFAMGVEGLQPGCYEVLPSERQVRRVGPLPPLTDLKALSGYFSRPADDPFAILLDEAPALLGLYVDLGLLRRRYGLRALRLGLLEAGHLAQTLLLTVGALGLGSTPINGLNDDLAHELFGLDDLDQPLQYLLPLGRPGD